MSRLAIVRILGAVLCLSPASSQEQADATKISSDVHTSIFKGPKPIEAGIRTERLAGALSGGPASTAKLPYKNFIDELVFGRMQKDSIPHAPLSTDQEFFRRINLDLTGRIPTAEDLRAFLADASPRKRAKLIDKLIGSPAFVDKWAYFYMDLIRANGKMGRGINLLHYTIKESLAADRPYDDFARSLITSSAKSNFVVAAVNPIVREHVEGKPGQEDGPNDTKKIHQSDTHDELTILYGRVFMGVNLSCVSCHDGAAHLEKVNVYLSKQKRSDFYQQAGFLGNTRYIPHVERTEAIMGHSVVDDLARGYDTRAESMLRIKRMGGPGTPKFLFTDELPRPGADPREELARMITGNPQFARATVNMYWAKLMNVGIVEPVDEFDLDRQDPNNLPEGWQLQPSNPELLNQLAAYFRKNNHSLHSLFRLICNSSAYQLSARFPGEWKDSYTSYYARKFARMLSAEELHDSITIATGRPGNFSGAVAKKAIVAADEEPATATVTMAMQSAMPKAQGDLKSFMAAFGQSNRATSSRPSQASPLQPIMLMRSPVVNDRVLAAKDSRVQRLLDSYPDNGKVVEELFLSTLSRQPLPAEKAFAVSILDKNRVEGAQNVEWALLNLVEFLYNF